MRNLEQNSRKTNQPTLFAAAFDIDVYFRAVLTEAIRRSPKKREQIAQEMSYLLGRRVTERMLYDFTSESQVNHRFPAAWLPALCEVLGTDAPLEVLIQKRPVLRDLVALARSVVREEQSDRELEARKEKFLAEHPGEILRCAQNDRGR